MKKLICWIKGHKWKYYYKYKNGNELYICERCKVRTILPIGEIWAAENMECIKVDKYFQDIMKQREKDLFEI